MVLLRTQLLMMWRAGVTPTSLLWLVLVVLAGCDDGGWSDVIETKVDPHANFTALQTFAFAAGVPNPHVEMAALPSDVAAGITALNEAVRVELESEGLAEVRAEQKPDLLVSSLISTDDQQALTWSCVPGQWWGYEPWATDPCAWLSPLYLEYDVGTAAVGLVHVATSTVPFAGVIQGVLTGSAHPNDRLVHDVHEMFKDYPAQQSGSTP
jgi:hypothetical protein